MECPDPVDGCLSMLVGEAIRLQAMDHFLGLDGPGSGPYGYGGDDRYGDLIGEFDGNGEDDPEIRF